MPRYQWIQKQNIGPAARSRHTMAYDRKRKQILLFGGLTSLKIGDGFQPFALSDTWIWDGVLWTQVSDMGPYYGNQNFRVPRRSISMTYDAQHESIVLYFEGGTWVWDGKYWSQVADIGPILKFEEHEIALACLHHSGKVYAHGNMDVGTWSWDGTEWLQVADTGPSRSQQSMICDESRQRLLLFEGETGVTWEWAGETWQPITSIGPGKGVDLQVACDGKRIVAIASQMRGNRIDRRGTWIWEDDSWKQVENMGPGPRIDCAVAGNTELGLIVLFGGGRSLDGDGMYFGDTWEYMVCPPVV